MADKKGKTVQDILELFSEFVTPEDIVFSKLSAEMTSILVKERIKKNMTQAEFADFLNVKQSQVSKWEHGGVNFSLKTIANLVAKLNLDTSIVAYSKSPSVADDALTITTSVNTYAKIIRPATPFMKTSVINETSRKDAFRTC